MIEWYKETFLVTKEDLNNLRGLSGKVNRYFCLFLNLLDIPTSSFHCCKDPDIITLDGIVLSIGSDKIRKQNLQYPWVIGECKTRYFLA